MDKSPGGGRGRSVASAATIFWFRRDLRIDDNHGLAQAIRLSRFVVPIFIFDLEILESLDRDDARVSFIHKAVNDLAQKLRERGIELRVFHGKPKDVFAKIFAQHKISSVVTNEDYEPYALNRDRQIAILAEKNGVAFHSYKDHVIYARSEVAKEDGSPYKVFTPYSKRWLQRYAAEKPGSFPSARLLADVVSGDVARSPCPSLAQLGFESSSISVPSLRIEKSILKNYGKDRDFMALDATTKIGLHLRFGTLSIREAVRLGYANSEVWLKELIWREFFSGILFHFPATVDKPFDPRFEKFPWRDSPGDFKRWCEGETGYPVVDAGMRELNETGFMHNRTRMIVGSFLCKHLLLDWRLGEKYFAKKLYDFELASNVGNWQWVAGCGVDAAPYFRIFNPELQTKRFDKSFEYIKKWVPEFEGRGYPEPMVDHEFARRRALIAYEKIKTIYPTTKSGLNA